MQLIVILLLAGALIQGSAELLEVLLNGLVEGVVGQAAFQRHLAALASQLARATRRAQRGNPALGGGE